MKKLKLNYILGYMLIMLLAVSCSESNKVVDEITDGVTRGAVLRQLDVVSNSVAINSATNELEPGEEFAVLLEYQDDEDGSLLSTMDVYVGYIDNTDDGVDNSRDEVKAETVDASAFSGGDRGLPQLLYSISAQDMQSTISLPNEGIGFGGDQFTVRFEINLSDGRSFTNTQNSGTITGSYFSSPFLNRVNVVCAPSKPTSGAWTISTTDSWGDGWNGGALNVVIDGADAGAFENVDSGQPGPVEITQDYELNVPDGAQTISIKYSSGAFDEEVTFRITSANGNEVATFGPNPPVGIELLDYCADNL